MAANDIFDRGPGIALGWLPLVFVALLALDVGELAGGQYTATCANAKTKQSTRCGGLLSIPCSDPCDGISQCSTGCTMVHVRERSASGTFQWPARDTRSCSLAGSVMDWHLCQPQCNCDCAACPLIMATPCQIGDPDPFLAFCGAA